MTGSRQGFLLLTCQLGDPGRKPLTVAQFRALAKRTMGADRELNTRELALEDVVKLGYDIPMAERIYGLLCDTNCLREYLRRAQACECNPITRLDPEYPLLTRKHLGLDSPGVLWAKGDVTLLNRPSVAVIGSRELNVDNQKFAAEAGRQIARQGYVLVSGNAKGADKAAQEACLEAGGNVISIVANSLQNQLPREHVLYLSLDAFDAPFSPQRALRRNHVIHTMATLTLAAQCTLGKGGTWDGVLTNLKQGWTPVCIFDDGSEAVADLHNRGVQTVTHGDLADLAALAQYNPSFLQD